VNEPQNHCGARARRALARWCAAFVVLALACVWPPRLALAEAG